MALPVILDADTGIDDALAILYALRSPELDVLACGSVGGNVDARTAARNILRVLEIAGASHVPVAVGCDRPLAEPKKDARGVHGEDGLGNTHQPPPQRQPVNEHAVDQLLRLSHRYKDRLVIIALGPLTNLAVALAKDPALAGRIARVVVMGGAAAVPGNVTPVAEANIAHDPEAAHAVLNAGWPVLMVGLDVTMKTILTAEQAGRLATAPDPAARFAYDILQHYMDRYSVVFGRRQCPLHDPLTVACAWDRSIVQVDRFQVQVELQGRWTRGMTVVDWRTRGAGNVELCLQVDAHRFVGHFLDRLMGMTGRRG